MGQTTVIPDWITIEDGLSQGFVTCLIQDNEGFLWIGSKNGLNRYDGEHIEVFNSNSENKYTISNDFITVLHDDVHFILIGTKEGLNLYVKSTKRFYEIQLGGLSFENNTQPNITGIVKDNVGQYWVSEDTTNSLYKFQIPDDFHENIERKKKAIDLIEIRKVPNLNNFFPYFLGIYKDDLLLMRRNTFPQKNIKGSINKLDVRTGKISLFDSQPLIEPSYINGMVFSNNMIIAQFWYYNNKIFGVFKNGRWKMINTNFKVLGISLMEKSNQVLIESGEKYMIFDDNVLEQTNIKESDAKFVLSPKKITHEALISDESDNYWIATKGYGLMKITPRKLQIGTHFKGKSIYAKPFITNEGDVYIGNPTTNENLFIVNSKEIETELKNIVNDVKMSPLINDCNGAIWGLFWEDGNYGISKLENEKAFNKRIIGKSVAPFTPIIVYDKTTHSILIVVDMQLSIYDIDSDTLKTVDFMDSFKSVVNRYDVARTPNGNYWIGTSQGLLQGVLTDNNQINFNLLSKKNGLQNNQVATLKADSEDANILWIGTKGGGLHRLNISEMSFEYINSKNGLPNDVIYGILEDSKSNLWMSTNLGIICYNKVSREVRNFIKADGLQSNEFNTYAYAKGGNGKMFFGGINGLNIFHPDNFNKNQNLPKVWITGLEVNNQNIEYGDASGLLFKAIEYTSSVTLPFHQNNVSIEYVGLEYTAPSKNNFSFYLEGAEKEWVHTTTDNKANYLNLPPGNYTFKVKAANGDGVWSEQIKSLKIQILAPWYRTNVAYIIYGVIGGLLILLVIKIREDKIRHKEQIEKSKLENKFLNQKIESSKKELNRFTQLLITKSKETKVLTMELDKFKTDSNESDFKNLENLLNTKILTDDQWLVFKEKFTAVYSDFFYELRNREYEFSEAEERLLTLEKLNLKTKEMAAILGIASTSVSRAKHRLKSKLGIDKTVSLIEFLKL